ncbi:MAG: S-methyl-5-thioribose-1-phosphate isomerase [Archangiaceae bacterium]|nr:S-methyl-5-thioribose-1-phosphate isomerase [Archangiaceae bacterium]
MEMIEPVEWRGTATSGTLWMIDQAALPQTERWIECRTSTEVAARIRDMTVRGAPAIGIAAAYGSVLASREPKPTDGLDALAASRPTAVNLFWAVEAMRPLLSSGPERCLEQARAIHRSDVENNRRMGATGAERLRDGMNVLTHCNAGPLATGGYGTALGVIFAAIEQGKRIHVWVDETRPRLQGARLTAWELTRAKVPCTLICDNMSASLMRAGRIDACVTGADRITRTGDTANKIGTYGVAVLAKHHGLPFYVAAPRSTFDLSLSDGAAIPIEERATSEVTDDRAGRLAAEGITAYNPSFDVTPAALISAIFTERGAIDPVTAERVSAVLES